MSTNERPGVYTSYEVDSGLRGKGTGGAVGLAATSASGTAGTVVTVTDYMSALSAFGGGNMTELVRILLENGAPAVCCCAVNGGDYSTAFHALMAEQDVKFMVCDSNSAAIHSTMLATIQAGDEKSKYRIGVVESGDSTRAALVGAAQSLNSERMVLVSHHCSDGPVGAAAAAVCGALAGESDPAVPMNGTKLAGIGNIGNNFSDNDVALLVRGGVLPLETVGGEIRVIRGITTRSRTADTADATWREVNTVRIIDTVIPAIRDVLHTGFARTKNTAQTRGAIRTQVIIELEHFIQREIIESYDHVAVNASQEDPTACEVSFGFTVAHGLNIIELSAHITV